MNTRSVAVALLLTSLACGGGASSEPAHAPFEGEWRVINKDGVENGQTIAFAKDTITLTTLGRPDTSAATYTTEGDAVTVRYKAWNYTLSMGEDDRHARFEGQDGGGVQYGLVRD